MKKDLRKLNWILKGDIKGEKLLGLFSDILIFGVSFVWLVKPIISILISNPSLSLDEPIQLPQWSKNQENNINLAWGFMSLGVMMFTGWIWTSWFSLRRKLWKYVVKTIKEGERNAD